MKRKINIMVITLLLGTVFLMGLKTSGSVVAHRALEQGDFSKALELYVMEGDSSGEGITYCAMKQYDSAIKSFTKAADHSGLGLAYCGKRDFDTAIQHFQQKNDNSGLGLAYCGKQDFTKAREYFTKANDRAGLGLAALGEKKYAEARDYFTRAKDNSGLGLVLLAEQKFDEALAHFQKYNNKSGMGMALLGKKKYDEAAAYFTQANDYSGLSLAYCGKRQFDTAITFAQKANDLSALGHAYCGKREYTKAYDYFSQANDLSGLSLVLSGKREFEKAIEYANKANDKKALGLAYLGQRKYDEAEAAFSSIHDYSGLSLVACGKKDFAAAVNYAQQANDYSVLSLAYCGRKNFTSAMDYARQANDLSAQGHASCGMNDFDSAISLFEQANDLSGLSQAYCGKREFVLAEQYAAQANDQSAIGYVYCGEKKFDEAIQCFQKANDNSGLSYAYCGKNDSLTALKYAQQANDKVAQGYAYLKQHDYQHALEKFKEAGDKTGIGFVYSQQNEFEEAEKYGLEINDKSLLGNIYLGLGNIRLAETYFQQANDSSGLGYVKLKDKKFDEAMQLFKKANDLSGQGFVFSEKGDHEKAEECFKQANDYSGLGRLALKKKQFKQALEYFKKANDYDGMGDIYWQLRDFDKAISLFNAGGNYLKVVQTIREKKYGGFEEAVAGARQGIAEGKFVYPLYLEIGKIYFEQNNYSGAIAEFEKVLTSGSYYASEALMWIGKIYFYQSKYDMAEASFAKLMNLYPDSQWYETAEKSIETIKYLKDSTGGPEGNNVQVSVQRPIRLTSQNRCGPESLKMLLASFGISSTSEEIARLAGTDAQGTTMLGLQKAAFQKGIKLSALRLSLQDLAECQAVAILLIDGNHYMLLQEKDKEGVTIADTSASIRISYPELSERWKGEILIVGDLNRGIKIASAELLKIKGGNRRTGEGGVTKNESGVTLTGEPNADSNAVGPNVPRDYLDANNKSDTGTGYNPPPGGGMGEAVLVNLNANVALGNLNCETHTDPISLSGGQLILPVLDLEIFGRGRNNGMKLILDRTYSSRSEVDGPLGFGWALYHNVRLEEVDPSNVVITSHDGTKLSYLYSGQGNYYYGPECDGSQLTKDGNGNYIWERWTQKYGKQFYHFDLNNNHRLSYIEDQNSNRLSYSYNSYGKLYRITDDPGRYLEFGYGANGKINSVTAKAGTLTVTYNYYYDANNNLIKVTGPENYQFEYAYEYSNNIHYITSVIDSNGNKTEYGYYQDGCVSTKDAEEHSAQLFYNYELGSTRVLDARARNTTYGYLRSKIISIYSSGKYTRYGYDENYIRNSTTDINGNKTSWINEAQYGNCLSVTDAEGRKIYMTFHPQFHRVTAITDAKSRKWEYKYDAKGNLVERMTPTPHVVGIGHTYYEYDQYGNMTKVTDAEGLITKYEYDTYGNTAKVIDGAGNYAVYSYDDFNRLISSGYGNTQQGDDDPITYEYDDLNRLQKKTYPDLSYEEYSYDNNGNLLSFRDANGHLTTYTYNKINQCVTETDAQGCTMRYEYDAFGNCTALIKSVNGRDLITRMEYNDDYSRLTKITDAEGIITEFTYLGAPPFTRSKDYTTMRKYKSNGTVLSVETRTYDKCYRLKGKKDGLGNLTEFTYDEVGNLKTVKDAKGNVTTYDYDPNCNVRITETNPLIKSTRYTYYKNGKLKSKIDANNKTINYTYDLAGRLKKITYPDTTSVEYQYNEFGGVSQMSDSRGVTTYTYDNRKRLTQVDGPEANDTITYAYDYAGNRVTLSAANEGTTSYAYFNNDLPQTITNSQNQTTTFVYDTAGRCIKMSYANGTSTNVAYYDNDRVKDVILKNSLQQTLSSYHYEYNKLEQLIKVTEEDADYYDYTYDDAGRLTHEDKKNSGNITQYYRDYGYDTAGNRSTENRNGTAITYSYNAGNQLLTRKSPTETITYQYNDNGNLITETSSLNGTKSYTYDFENWLTQVIGPASKLTSYQYSGDGLRISANNNGSVVKYLYDGLIPVVERDSAGTTLAVYTRIPDAPGGIGGLISSRNGANTYYYHDSHLGNVNQVTNSTGAVVQTYDYDAFGNIVSQTGSLTNQYKYQTKEASLDMGLVFFGARYYNPLIGRFVTTDPLGMVDGANLYLYCGNDPVGIVDPYGLWGVWFGSWHLGDDSPWLVFDMSSWFDAEQGAYATIDGFIPFWDPFKDRYNQCSSTLQWSKFLGRTSRDLFVSAGVWRIIGPYSTRGLPKWIQRIRKYIRYDRPHHNQPYHWGGDWIK